MFEIKRKNNQITITVKPAIPGAESWEYYFRRDEADEPSAQLLVNAINARMTKLLKETRQEYYDNGYKDAKAKRKKADWIGGWW